MGIETEGQIIGFQRLAIPSPTNPQGAFVPIVEFPTKSGKRVTFMGAPPQSDSGQTTSRVKL